MEQQCGWLTGSLRCDAYSSVTSGHQWLSARQYIDRACADQSSALQCGSDIGSSTDVQSVVAVAEPHVGSSDSTSNTCGQILMPNECRSRSSCNMSSCHEQFQLLTSTDGVCIDADSTGMPVATEVIVDRRGELPSIKLEMYPTRGQSDISVEDFNGEIQPLGDSSICSVCGDTAVGFHCGAYVCEACKVNTSIYRA